MTIHKSRTGVSGSNHAFAEEDYVENLRINYG
jgi:hypothetical protein